MKKWICAVLCVSVSACAWVTLTPNGEKVRVLDTGEVTTCKALGDAMVATMAKVAGINRSEAQIEKELVLLARNAAADMGGDTVVAEGEVNAGKRRYIVYKCVGVNAS